MAWQTNLMQNTCDVRKILLRRPRGRPLRIRLLQAEVIARRELTDCRRSEVQVFPVLVKGVPEVFNRSVNQLRVLGRWVRMFTIPGQSLVPVSATAGSTNHYLQSGNFP